MWSPERIIVLLQPKNVIWARFNIDMPLYCYIQSHLRDKMIDHKIILSPQWDSRCWSDGIFISKWNPWCVYEWWSKMYYWNVQKGSHWLAKTRIPPRACNLLCVKLAVFWLVYWNERKTLIGLLQTNHPEQVTKLSIEWWSKLSSDWCSGMKGSLWLAQ